MCVSVCEGVGCGVVVVGRGGGLLLPGCGKESIFCDAKANECMSDA